MKKYLITLGLYLNGHIAKTDDYITQARSLEHAKKTARKFAKAKEFLVRHAECRSPVVEVDVMVEKVAEVIEE